MTKNKPMYFVLSLHCSHSPLKSQWSREKTIKSQKQKLVNKRVDKNASSATQRQRSDQKARKPHVHVTGIRIKHNEARKKAIRAACFSSSLSLHLIDLSTWMRSQTINYCQISRQLTMQRTRKITEHNDKWTRTKSWHGHKRESKQLLKTKEKITKRKGRVYGQVSHSRLDLAKEAKQSWLELHLTVRGTWVVAVVADARKRADHHSNLLLRLQLGRKVKRTAIDHWTHQDWGECWRDDGWYHRLQMWRY